MDRRFFKDVGIIIKRFSYREADRVLTLMTKRHGRITVLAKGVRKMNSRKRGSVELFNVVKIQAVKGKGFHILTEVETLEPLETLRNDLDKVKSAFYLCELIDKMIPEHETNSLVYELLSKSLRGLSNPNADIRVWENYFKHRIVRILGFWPDDRRVPRDINALIANIVEKPITAENGWNLRA